MGNLARKKYERDTQSCMLRQAFNRIISPCIIWIAVAGFGLAGLFWIFETCFWDTRKEEFCLESWKRIWKWWKWVFWSEEIKAFLGNNTLRFVKKFLKVLGLNIPTPVTAARSSLKPNLPSTSSSVIHSNGFTSQAIRSNDILMTSKPMPLFSLIMNRWSRKLFISKQIPNDVIKILRATR